MSNRPVEDLLDEVGDSRVLAEALEQHLDDHPYGVDDAAAEDIARRLHARLRPRRHVTSLRVAAVIAIAAAALVTVTVSSPSPSPLAVAPMDNGMGVALTDPTGATSLAAGPGTVSFAALGRRADMTTAVHVVSAHDANTVVVLVQSGEIVADDGTAASTGEWLMMTRLEDGTPHTAVFPDGEPPPSHPDVWDSASVESTLKSARWQALPDRTLDTLSRLLEQP